MFTGIVEEIGNIRQLKRGQKSLQITVGATKILEDLPMGDSVAVNGVCLTARNITATTFMADVMEETLNRTSFSRMRQGQNVNLERALGANGRFGGHIVSGHIDGVGTIAEIQKNEIARLLTIHTSPKLLRYMIEKGSVALNGVSLTIASINETGFQISIIPHTLNETTVGSAQVGTVVNLECDMIGKYIEKLISNKTEPKKEIINSDFLLHNGF